MIPSLMRAMSDGHLIAALEAEGPLTPAEAELCKRLGRYAEQEPAEEVEARLERSYEAAMEQSEFRRQVIENILVFCESPGSKRELVGSIRTEVENSYVEL